MNADSLTILCVAVIHNFFFPICPSESSAVHIYPGASQFTHALLFHICHLLLYLSDGNSGEMKTRTLTALLFPRPHYIHLGRGGVKKIPSL